MKLNDLISFECAKYLCLGSSCLMSTALLIASAFYFAESQDIVGASAFAGGVAQSLVNLGCIAKCKDSVEDDSKKIRFVDDEEYNKLIDDAEMILDIK